MLWQTEILSLGLCVDLPTRRAFALSAGSNRLRRGVWYANDVGIGHADARRS